MFARKQLSAITLDTLASVADLIAQGIELLHCWPYIREWMIREKGRER